jgi:hypothetical protein
MPMPHVRLSLTDPPPRVGRRASKRGAGMTLVTCDSDEPGSTPPTREHHHHEAERACLSLSPPLRVFSQRPAPPRDGRHLQRARTAAAHPAALPARRASAAGTPVAGAACCLGARRCLCTRKCAVCVLPTEVHTYACHSLWARGLRVCLIGKKFGV